MKMLAEMEFHSGLDEVWEHLHSLDLLFPFPLVRERKIWNVSIQNNILNHAIQPLYEPSCWSKPTNHVTD